MRAAIALAAFTICATLQPPTTTGGVLGFYLVASTMTIMAAVEDWLSLLAKVKG